MKWAFIIIFSTLFISTAFAADLDVECNAPTSVMRGSSFNVNCTLNASEEATGELHFRTADFGGTSGAVITHYFIGDARGKYKYVPEVSTNVPWGSFVLPNRDIDILQVSSHRGRRLIHWVERLIYPAKKEKVYYFYFRLKATNRSEVSQINLRYRGTLYKPAPGCSDGWIRDPVPSGCVPGDERGFLQSPTNNLRIGLVGQGSAGICGDGQCDRNESIYCFQDCTDRTANWLDINVRYSGASQSGVTVFSSTSPKDYRYMGQSNWDGVYRMFVPDTTRTYYLKAEYDRYAVEKEVSQEEIASESVTLDIPNSCTEDYDCRFGHNCTNSRCGVGRQKNTTKFVITNIIIDEQSRPTTSGGAEGKKVYIIEPPQQEPEPVCGDETCEGDETKSNCCQDCGCFPGQLCKSGKCVKSLLTAPLKEMYCGDSICNLKEDCSSCPQDCSCQEDEICKNIGSMLSPEYQCSKVACGDGTCDDGEYCCEDCGCKDAYSCGCMGAETCEADQKVCIFEGACGNGGCDLSESSETCCMDCGCPADRVCKKEFAWWPYSQKTCVLSVTCGDGTCNGDENCNSCAQDCGCATDQSCNKKGLIYTSYTCEALPQATTCTDGWCSGPNVCVEGVCKDIEEAIPRALPEALDKMNSPEERVCSHTGLDKDDLKQTYTAREKWDRAGNEWMATYLQFDCGWWCETTIFRTDHFGLDTWCSNNWVTETPSTPSYN